MNALGNSGTTGSLVVLLLAIKNYRNVPSVPKFVTKFSQVFKNAKRAPTICAARKGSTSVGRILAKIGSLWSLRVWGPRLEISGQAEFFPGPRFF
jgi:hypothetical protein